MTVRPLQDRVLVARKEKEEVRPSGLIVVGDPTPQLRGVVLACGPGRVLPDGTLVPVEVSVGDDVFYAPYTGTEIKIEGQDCLILRESDLLCVVSTGE